MTRRSYLLAAAALWTLLPLSVLGADTEETAAPLPPEGAKVEPKPLAARAALADDNAGGEAWFAPGIRDVNGRFGWWGMTSSGSPTKVGEFQSLDSSPFWDIDGLLSNGDRTVDFTATGTDNEGTQGRLYYFSPKLTVKTDYERFFRRLDRRGVEVPGPLPFDGTIFENFNPTSGSSASQRVLNSDVLNPGQDYAIRVQEFKTSFKGTITENLKWRLNVWGMDKEGFRQASKLGHCFDESLITAGQPSGNRCHLLAQPQHIDWRTTEVEPVIEAKLGPITAEYSRTMRAFDQNDQVVTRRYSNASHDGWPITGADIPYDVLVDNFTQIDRLKLSCDVTDYDHFYTYMYVGDTENKYRDTHRFFNGFDLRWTNDRAENLKWTAYAKKSREDNQLPSTFPEAPLVQGGDTIADYHHPINYDRTAAGLKSQWKPFASGWPAARGFAITAGYEWARLNRNFADYEAEDARWVSAVGPPQVFDTWEFEQPDTVTNAVNVTASMRWSSRFDSFLRYKYTNVHNPLFGFRATNGEENTNQPDQINVVEIGGTWMPAGNFLVTATVGVEARNNRTEFDNLGQAFAVFHTNPREFGFDELNYPIVVSAWYAPSSKWSLTGGYASFTNWIDQTITLGDLFGDNLLNTTGSAVANGSPPPNFIGARDYFEPDAFQSRWRYGGQAQVINLGANYACTERVRLTGGYEYTWGHDRILAAPSPATALDPSDTVAPPTTIVPDWTLIPSLSQVVVQTNRITAGVDYLARERITVFFRYNFFDYRDLGGTGDSGQVHGFLGGMSAVF
jgi:hypothetical protein